MNLNQSIFYSAFENKVYVHNVDNQNDYIFSEIVFDILEYCKKNPNCTVQDILTMLEITGKKIPCVELLGVQPYSLEAGINLTESMQKLLQLFADKALEILKSWNVKTLLD